VFATKVSGVRVQGSVQCAEGAARWRKNGRVEDWKDGRMAYWSNGVVDFWNVALVLLCFAKLSPQYSILPFFVHLAAPSAF
jgi:hypothetical protein